VNNCTITDNLAHGYGGGMHSYDGLISNCTITDNRAYDYGGGLSACNGTISNCTISNNAGSGLSACNSTISNCAISNNTGRGLSACNGTISNCTISNNARGGLSGCNGGISSCTITGNKVRYGDGGGLYWCDGTITNCTITGNAASGDGGGMCECGGTITNCTITGNAAPGDGGGVCECGGTITNCTITGNLAKWYGGGVCECGGAIWNCTITGNKARYSDGGGLYDCDGTIGDCIVWGNQAGREGEQLYGCEAAVITYCCVQEWTGWGEGNISDDPLFVKGPLGDYYLSCRAAGQAVDSACIDAGSATAESLGLDKFTTRTDGVPDAGAVDMGYHYPPALDQNLPIECWLNESEFAPGDLLIGFIEAQNSGVDLAVDAYVGFLLPNGEAISLTSSGLTIGIYPWVSNAVLPSGFHFGPTEVLRTTVPGGAGSYLFAAALTEPGQFEFIGEPSLFPFTITE
jgi:hypothetical protein